MTGIEAIAALAPSNAANATAATGPARANALPERPVEADFGSLLTQGIASVDAKVAHADALVAQFAIDDSIPVHQVTVALEEARLSVEFAMQVRARLVEGYKELMNMQL
jgi:flagellar hook-basal body complex protein FliE